MTAKKRKTLALTIIFMSSFFAFFCGLLFYIGQFKHFVLFGLLCGVGYGIESIVVSYLYKKLRLV